MFKPRKFRAWDAKAKKMHYFEGIFNQHPYIERSTFPQYESVREYPELVVTEWTGLVDKNGKDIYEGDLLSTFNDGSDGADAWTELDLGVVCWDEEHARWQHNIDTGTNESMYSKRYVYVTGHIFF